MRKPTTIILILGSVGGLAAAGAAAQARNADIRANPAGTAYLQDGRGVIARSGSGMCWRSGYWTPADAVIGCDGELKPPIANPIAPPLPGEPFPAPGRSTVTSTSNRCDFDVTLASDAAFSFGKSTLNAAARRQIEQETIEKLATCSKVETITVTGHADSIGNPGLNQKLSEKRAAAVAAYLGSNGVTGKIEVIGKGETEPLKICSEGLPRRRLIDCLAPNRRVSIEVRGTQP